MVQLRRSRTPFYFISKQTTILKKSKYSQENESKFQKLRTGVDFDGQFSGTLDVRNFSRVNTGKSAIVFSFRFQWFQMAFSKFLF
ncbi:unnamed protein product [Rhizophagus irregularis]|uniref:Uncharacterized protein n=1 Tax=Rhizophagus irregularis TaxID=588596 RepID=A0A916E3S0_9GLOM|nr:unnamed protein product [Rhizophagus irregularis]CAB5359891.1 unnamed protein product [Rhizophagus irregularis]